MTDIVERLRQKWWRWANTPGRTMELEAADEIERLRAENAGLKFALDSSPQTFTALIECVRERCAVEAWMEGMRQDGIRRVQEAREVGGKCASAIRELSTEELLKPSHE